MSTQLITVLFSCNADASANDYTVSLEQRIDSNTVLLGARYKSSQPNRLYQIEMDADDLQAFGELCIAVARLLRNAGTDVSAKRE
jgi:hypothetical protein